MRAGQARAYPSELHRKARDRIAARPLDVYAQPFNQRGLLSVELDAKLRKESGVDVAPLADESTLAVRRNQRRIAGDSYAPRQVLECEPC